MGDNIVDLFDFLPKSKIKAGEGLDNGKFPFYTSSEYLTKFINHFSFTPPCLIFGTGGKASIHYSEQKFSASNDCIVLFNKKSIILLFVFISVIYIIFKIFII